MKLDPTPDGFVIDAEDLAPQLGLMPSEIAPMMRAGEITSRSETGVGDDAGRSRITFRYRDIRVRLTVDDEGNVLKQSRLVMGAPKGR